MRSLVEVYAEEAVFRFFEVNWETPFQGPFFKVVESLLDGMRGF